MGDISGCLKQQFHKLGYGEKKGFIIDEILGDMPQGISAGAYHARIKIEKKELNKLKVRAIRRE